MRKSLKKHKIISLTGLDCIGKETQTKLLAQVLQPSERMTFPDYDHWSGEILRHILREEKFGLVDAPYDSYLHLPHFQTKHPEIFQLLQCINRLAHQDEIKRKLETRHLVMDRYTEDAFAFGLQDGCSLDLLVNLDRLYVPSDLVIVLLGKRFPRPGEVPDINERDDSFQTSVREKYESLARVFTHFNLIDVDQLRVPDDPAMSIWWVHKKICSRVEEFLGETVTPLTYEEIKEQLAAWKKPELVTSS
jgi:thymidylate kinase